MSGTANEDLVARVFRVQNTSRVSIPGTPRTRVWVAARAHPCSCFFAWLLCPQLQEGHLLVRHFQFLRWSAYRDTPDSRKAFLHLLAEVDKWQAESGDGRTVVHCL